MAGVGDVGIQGSDTEGNYGRITNAARVVVERGALIIVIGDDHSISYPLGRGMEPLGEFDVVHIDASRRVGCAASRSTRRAESCPRGLTTRPPTTRIKLVSLIGWYAIWGPTSTTEVVPA